MEALLGYMQRESDNSNPNVSRLDRRSSPDHFARSYIDGSSVDRRSPYSPDKDLDSSICHSSSRTFATRYDPAPSHHRVPSTHTSVDSCPPRHNPGWMSAVQVPHRSLRRTADNHDGR